MSNLDRYLVHGFRYGFRIQFIGNRAPFESPNLKSALQNPDLVMSKLQKEIDAGRIVGPYVIWKIINRCLPRKSKILPNINDNPTNLADKFNEYFTTVGSLTAQKAYDLAVEYDFNSATISPSFSCCYRTGGLKGYQGLVFKQSTRP